MKRTTNLILILMVMILVIAACGSGSAGDTTTEPPNDAGTVTTDQPDTTVAAADEETNGESEDPVVDGPLEPPDLEPGAFGDPTNVDHKWFPLIPGTQLIFEGVTLDKDEDEEIPHRVIFTVTDLTKMIGGVESVVIWDQDFSEGELVETEIAFFAQDDEGNVWRMGEYPEEYEDGEFVEAPSWIHGIDGSRAGIHMPASPQTGTPSFPQGWAPSVEWTDRGKVFEVGTQTCVPVDCFEDVLIVDEFSLDELTFFQVKYYAPGVGNVEVGWKGNDPEGETLELVAWNLLDAAGLADAREAALALEENGYERSEVYAQTEPIDVP